ncbi:MAG: hypothetical protein IJG63_02365 [Oscillospiraceae bacterium]|nr:hypothetical protein [Oscillospiraceae bacterium]
MKKRWRFAAACLAVLLMLILAACAGGTAGQQEPQTETDSSAGAQSDVQEQTADEDSPEGQTEKNGDIYSVHKRCARGIDKGFGYAGVQQIRDTLETQGYETILVDDGDAIQGESVAMLSRGETIIELMNEMDYDLAVPGNHEFDYGVDHFLELADMAEFQYLSCNLNREGELLFEPFTV